MGFSLYIVDYWLMNKTSLVPKLFETITRDAIIARLFKNNLLTPTQYGLQNSRSTRLFKPRISAAWSWFIYCFWWNLFIQGHPELLVKLPVYDVSDPLLGLVHFFKKPATSVLNLMTLLPRLSSSSTVSSKEVLLVRSTTLSSLMIFLIELFIEKHSCLLTT